jgi:hypothetical protein
LGFVYLLQQDFLPIYWIRKRTCVAKWLEKRWRYISNYVVLDLMLLYFMCLQFNKQNSYWYRVQYQGIQTHTALRSWYGSFSLVRTMTLGQSVYPDIALHISNYYIDMTFFISARVSSRDAVEGWYGLRDDMEKVMY